MKVYVFNINRLFIDLYRSRRKGTISKKRYEHYRNLFLNLPEGLNWAKQCHGEVCTAFRGELYIGGYSIEPQWCEVRDG